MKYAVLLALSSLVAAPALAQMAPAPASAAAAGALTIDTPVEVIAANPKGKAVLDADVPGMTADPMFDQFKSMSLVQLEPMSQGHITAEIIAKVKTHLAAIK